MSGIKNMSKHREAIYEFIVVFEPNGSGYTVTVPKLPGLVTEGSTLAEARVMAKDAIRCHLRGLLKSVPLRSSAVEKHHKIKLAI